MQPQELNDRFGIEGAAVFEAGPGDLTQLSITAAGGSARLIVHGAHVTDFAPEGGRPVLWISRRSRFEPGKPIRGGVPICWPWCGGDPHHGFARLREWTVEAVRRAADGRVTAELSLRDDEATRALWPHPFELRYAVTVGPALEMALTTTNRGDEAFPLVEALHPYLAVSDLREVRILGIEGTEYIDIVGEPTRRNQEDEPIVFVAETDRQYLNTTAPLTLVDPGAERRIVVTKSGSDSTVIWNPWVDKAVHMPDYGDGEWPEMVCIEPANIADNARTVEPGQSHTLAATIAVEAGG